MSAYLAPQFRTGQAPVTQHNHAHFPGDRRGQGLQQFHYRVHLSPALVGALDWPYTQQVFKLERSFEYVKEGKTTFDAVYGITSLGFPPSFSAVKRRSFGLYTISGVMGTKPAPSPRRLGAEARPSERGCAALARQGPRSHPVHIHGPHSHLIVCTCRKARDVRRGGLAGYAPRDISASAS